MTIKRINAAWDRVAGRIDAPKQQYSPSPDPQRAREKLAALLFRAPVPAGRPQSWARAS